MKILANVNVKFGDGRKYDIEIGSGNTRSVGECAAALSPRAQAFIVTDRNIPPLLLKKLSGGLKAAGIPSHTEILPPGEQVKTLARYGMLLKRITEFDDARDLIVIALGGGVIGDLAGFVAATYKRGVKLIQVPTTLLSCVDSSVGGKTAVDLPAGKNLVGSFYQPQKVVIDIDALSTLPARELRAGYAEVAKTALIFDVKFFEFLEKNYADVLRGSAEHAAEAIRRCCEHKARVVVEDERDVSGRRALLNFGHTFGHAAEAALGYRKLRHGEGVAAGMACAAELSALRGMIKDADVKRVEDHIRAAGLPVAYRGCSPAELLDRMKVDKKFAAGENRFVLLDAIGRASLVRNIPKYEIMAVLNNRTIPAKSK